jgi:phosphoglycolate phosphatase
VGDTQGDCDACRQAGVPFIYAEYGFGDVDDHSHVISSLLELPDVVDSVLA